MHIGIIVSDDQKIASSPFIKVVSPDDYRDDGSYTLFVGKNTVSAILPDYTLKYLDKKIDEKHFWTFSKYEKRNIFEDDIKKFREYVFERVFKSLEYVPIESLLSSYTDIKNIINKLSDDKEKFSFISENGVYTFYNGTVYGLSFDELEYIGIDRERLIHFLRKFRKVRLIFNDKFISNGDKTAFNAEAKYVPYLYFLSNSQYF